MNSDWIVQPQDKTMISIWQVLEGIGHAIQALHMTGMIQYIFQLR